MLSCSLSSIQDNLVNFLPVPKLLRWDWNLSQSHRCDRTILVTSGCSFTASTLTLDSANSWPGFVRDRCRFDHAVDWSMPGSGNLYISDSIIKYVKSLTESQKQDIFVVVMWSGLDREEDVSLSLEQPCIDGFSYQRRDPRLSKKQQALDSYNNIIRTKEYLEQQKIPFAFTFYMNLLYPPCLPSRDTTHTFNSFLDSDRLSNLKKLCWTPSNPNDYLYDFSFYHNYLDQSSDKFHPGSGCILDWTDTVLLPSLTQQKLINLYSR